MDQHTPNNIAEFDRWWATVVERPALEDSAKLYARRAWMAARAVQDRGEK